MNPTRQIIRATAVAIATTAVLSGAAVAADATGSSRPPSLQKSLAQLVAAGAPGAILLARDIGLVAALDDRCFHRVQEVWPQEVSGKECAVEGGDVAGC